MKFFLYHFKHIIFCCFFLLFNESFSQGIVQQILNNGSTDKRINVVILAEGYLSSEKSKFISDAVQALNNFMNVSPYSGYKSYFNAYAVFIPSEESGSDHPSKGIYRNTYFNSTFESYGIERLITIPPNDIDPLYSNGYGKVYSLLRNLMPEYDIVLMIVNDNQYGGSGGSIAITSTNSSSLDVALHEIGHSFGQLGDEYSDYTPGYSGSERPNTTAETRREYIKWTKWISSSTPVPTPATSQYSDIPGLFEGACYESKGWYRPKLNCKMKSLGIPFCEVCREQIIKSLYNVINPIESYFPVQKTYSIDNGITLSILPMQPLGSNMSIEWYVNDILINGYHLTSLDINRDNLSLGPIEVKVKVTDLSAMVKNDQFGLLCDSVLWKISANPAVQLNAPVLASPSNNNIKVNPNTLFKWNEAANAASYNLQISTSATEWSSPVENITGITGTSYQSMGVLSGGKKYYWRVSAVNGNTVSDWSYTWSFTTEILKPNPPSLLLPLNNVINLATGLTLSWDTVQGASSYRVQLSASELFSTIILDDSGITLPSKKISNLQNNTTYYWRVCAKNSNGTGDWSEIYNFTTINVIPVAPVLVSPLNNAEDQQKEIALTWNPVPNSLSCQMQISVQSGFSSLIKDTTGITSNSISIKGLKGKQIYYWRVCGKNSAGSGAWSGVWSFKTLNTSPGKFSLIKPSNDELITLSIPKKAIKFSWNRSIDPDEDDTVKYSLTITGPGYNLNKEKLKDTSILLDIMADLNPGKTYSWKVTATDGKNNISTSTLNFITAENTAEIVTEKEILKVFNLNQNFPNPFNPSTMISFQLPAECQVILKVYDIIGKEVYTIINRPMEAGEHSITFEPQGIPGGIYFYKLQAGNYTAMRKMIYLR
jgi:hypothetical protein